MNWKPNRRAHQIHREVDDAKKQHRIWMAEREKEHKEFMEALPAIEKEWAKWVFDVAAILLVLALLFSFFYWICK